jgi:hypothetical protein
MTIEVKAAGHHDVPQALVQPAVMPLPDPGGDQDRRRQQQQQHPPTHANHMFSGNTSALIKRYRVEIGASSSSVFSTLVAFPLDSVKTRMQTYQYKGFLDCVKHTYRTEKLGGFFRGASSP